MQQVNFELNNGYREKQSVKTGRFFTFKRSKLICAKCTKINRYNYTKQWFNVKLLRKPETSAMIIIQSLT